MSAVLAGGGVVVAAAVLGVVLAATGRGAFASRSESGVAEIKKASAPSVRSKAARLRATEFFCTKSLYVGPRTESMYACGMGESNSRPKFGKLVFCH